MIPWTSLPFTATTGGPVGASASKVTQLTTTEELLAICTFTCSGTPKPELQVVTFPVALATQ